MKLNPFASRYTNPLTCQFVSPESANDGGHQVKQLAERLKELRGLTQIVGPHGSGKSTLACAIGRELYPLTGNIRCITFRPHARRNLWTSFVSTPPLDSEGRLEQDGNSDSDQRKMLIVDGIELLSPINRMALLIHSRRKFCQTLITTHRKLRLIPILTVLKPSLPHFRKIVEQLQMDCATKVADEQIASAFLECDKDYRLALRNLFDIWRESNKQPTPPVNPAEANLEVETLGLRD